MKTKPCITCGSTITKGYYEGKARWEKHKYCSLTCRPIWNKGLTAEDERVAKYLKGSKKTQFTKGSTLASKNINWKGDTASYTAKHIWIKYHYGKAQSCENVDCSGVSKTYHWSNISGTYQRDRKDWQQLCVSCHKKYDLLRKEPYGNS
jgi:hypothetical protein